MHIVLWDTCRHGASKDFAGGMGVGVYPGHGGLRGRLMRHFFRRDYRPVALLFAHLAAIFQRLGHAVEYSLDRIVPHADLHVFCPALMTLDLEQEAMRRLRAARPEARILVVGAVASAMPSAFAGLDVTVIKGEAEQLLWKFDDVLDRPGAVVQLGTLENLDDLPMPDWSPFNPARFRIGYDFWKFPTALIQASRGCTFKCNYCPYIILENTTRFRSPEAVVDEMRFGMQKWGFRSFKFRDPLFGLDREQVFRLAELFGRLPRPIQFSVESRIELMRPEVLRVLRRVGLTSVTVGIETPDEATLRRYHRVPVNDDRQREFIGLCRRLGIRTVAGFMIGFPEDTSESIHRVADYAKLIGPTFANFNIVTPYPGTEFYAQIHDRIANHDLSQYTVYEPLLKYEHLTAEEVRQLHAWCFRRFFFRWQYLRENGPLLWPVLQRLGWGRPSTAAGETDAPHAGPPAPASAADALRRKGLRQDSPHF